MIKSIFTLLIVAGFSTPAWAGTVVQAKGKTAIIELDNDEFNSIQPTAGGRVRITSDDTKTLAAIRKVSKKRILVITGASLEGQSSVQVTSASGGAASSPSSPSASRSNSGKKWLYGANIKYINGSASVSIGSDSASAAYSGFGGSAVVLYSLGTNLAVGAEGEIAMNKGSGSVGSITQMQTSAIGEYRFNAFSAGLSFTPFSNFKFADNAGNDNSLNGMGFGVFGTYSVGTNIRVLFDYKMMNYKLDPATVKANDFRIGAGYYF